jgi:hypothetical protein
MLGAMQFMAGTLAHGHAAVALRLRVQVGCSNWNGRRVRLLLSSFSRDHGVARSKGQATALQMVQY